MATLQPHPLLAPTRASSERSSAKGSSRQVMPFRSSKNGKGNILVDTWITNFKEQTALPMAVKQDGAAEHDEETPPSEADLAASNADLVFPRERVANGQPLGPPSTSYHHHQHDAADRATLLRKFTVHTTSSRRLQGLADAGLMLLALLPTVLMRLIRTAMGLLGITEHRWRGISMVVPLTPEDRAQLELIVRNLIAGRLGRRPEAPRRGPVPPTQQLLLDTHAILAAAASTAAAFSLPYSGMPEAALQAKLAAYLRGVAASDSVCTQDCLKAMRKLARKTLAALCSAAPRQPGPAPAAAGAGAASSSSSSTSGAAGIVLAALRSAPSMSRFLARPKPRTVAKAFMAACLLEQSRSQPDTLIQLVARLPDGSGDIVETVSLVPLAPGAEYLRLLGAAAGDPTRFAEQLEAATEFGRLRPSDAKRDPAMQGMAINARVHGVGVVRYGALAATGGAALPRGGAAAAAAGYKGAVPGEVLLGGDGPTTCLPGQRADGPLPPPPPQQPSQQPQHEESALARLRRQIQEREAEDAAAAATAVSVSMSAGEEEVQAAGPGVGEDDLDGKWKRRRAGGAGAVAEATANGTGAAALGAGGSRRLDATTAAAAAAAAAGRALGNGVVGSRADVDVDVDGGGTVSRTPSDGGDSVSSGDGGDTETLLRRVRQRNGTTSSQPDLTDPRLGSPAPSKKTGMAGAASRKLAAATASVKALVAGPAAAAAATASPAELTALTTPATTSATPAAGAAAASTSAILDDYGCGILQAAAAAAGASPRKRQQQQQDLRARPPSFTAASGPSTVIPHYPTAALDVFQAIYACPRSGAFAVHGRLPRGVGLSRLQTAYSSCHAMPAAAQTALLARLGYSSPDELREEVELRKALCVAQALPVVIASLRLMCGSAACLRSAHRTGSFLHVQQSLLSDLHRHERGYLEDTKGALDVLADRLVVRFVEGSEKVLPLHVSGTSITVSLPADCVSAAALEAAGLSRETFCGATYGLTALLFNMGINSLQSLGFITWGGPEETLQDTLNKHSLERLSEYAQRAGQTVGPHLAALNRHFGPEGRRPPKDTAMFGLVRRATVEVGGGRAVNCKSGKDRTALEVSKALAEEVVEAGLLPPSQTSWLEGQFLRGLSYVTTSQNHGQPPAYAFNEMEILTLPLGWRPDWRLCGKVAS